MGGSHQEGWHSTHLHFTAPIKHFQSSGEIKLREGLFKRILFEWFLQRLLQYESLCLIEISSCLVKHTEVTQKYISELTELKKSKDYMQPEQNTFLYFLPIFKPGWNPSAVPHGRHKRLIWKCRDRFVWKLRHTSHSIYKETFTDTLIKSYHQEINPFNPSILTNYSAQSKLSGCLESAFSSLLNLPFIQNTKYVPSEHLPLILTLSRSPTFSEV